MRGWLLVLVLLGGCTGPTAPAVDEAPAVVTDPTDFAGSRDGSHVHDYWGGQSRLTLLEGTDGCASCTVSYGGDHGVTLGMFRAESDHVVPMGTAFVHATASWKVESGDYKDVALYVKTANTTAPVFVGVLDQGATFIFNSTNDDNDPPHHRLSLWEFEVRGRSPDGDGASATNFEASLRIDVVRGLEIPVFPPHPDHWNGSSELVLHQSTRTVQQQLETPTYWTCSGCLGRHAPDNGRIVPPSATEVEVVVEVVDGLPGTFDLMVHGADTWDHVQVTATEEDTERTRLVWRLPVEGRPDSPYAKQSLWDLYVVNDQAGPVKYWQGTYDITVTAIR